MASLQSKTVGELTVAELLQLLQSLSVAQPTKTQKAKKDPDAPKKEVSAGVAAWNLFVGEVLEELKAEGWTHPETGKPVTRKDAMAEASKRKAEGNADYAAASAARRAKRDEQLAKKAAPASAPASPAKPAPAEASPEKPKKVLSPEHLAKMQAAAKAAREAKKASAAKPAPVAAAPPSPPPVEEEEEWIRKTISGKKHLWNPSNNHCYRCEADGSQGEWAGLYNPKTQKIDDSVEEPQDE